MKTSDQINELCAALVCAQGAIENAIANARNPHFDSTYADLASVRDAVRKPLATNGLAIIQIPFTREGKPFLASRLVHKSGQWIEDECQLFVDKPTMQAVGSAITYMKRYMIEAMTGVAEKDDDGNEASKQSSNNEPKSKPSVIPKPIAQPKQTDFNNMQLEDLPF